MLGCLALVTVLAACSSSEHDAAPVPITPVDSGSANDAAHPTIPDSSTPPADGSLGTDGSLMVDGASECKDSVGDSGADFFIDLSGDASYDGPVLVESADAGVLELLTQGDSGGLQAHFGGVQPTVPDGMTLWANLHRTTFRANPFASMTTTAGSSVSVSEHGPFLAQTLSTFVPTNPPTLTFLGAEASFSRLCSRREITNLVTGESCFTTDQYSMTLHGDADIALVPGSEGHVTIKGIEYDVWLARASVGVDTSAPGHGACTPDAPPYPGLSLAGRAVDYEDVLKGKAQGAGVDSSR